MTRTDDLDSSKEQQKSRKICEIILNSETTIYMWNQPYYERKW
ncbi:MAG: hypothetical protein PHR50_10910 [Lachnospiraceae bacterium]|nr:hypothetical protein [Lachnospiraceae bacterium]